MTKVIGLLINATRFQLPLLVLFLGLWLSCQEAQSREKTYDCLSIQQTNKYYGNLNLFLTSDRVRVEISNSNTTIICKAPTWRVSAFNTEGKVEMSRSLDQWCKEGGFGFGADPESKSIWREQIVRSAKKSPSKYMGLNVYELSTPMNWKARIESQHKSVMQHGKFKLLIASDCLNVTEPQVRFLRTLFASPQVGSVPLYACYESPSVLDVMYQTKNVKKEPMPATAFEYPSKFRQVQTFTQLAIGVLRLQKDSIRDIIDEIGGNYEKPPRH